jgi:hypothetical protein
LGSSGSIRASHIGVLQFGQSGREFPISGFVPGAQKRLTGFCPDEEFGWYLFVQCDGRKTNAVVKVSEKGAPFEEQARKN